MNNGLNGTIYDNYFYCSTHGADYKINLVPNENNEYSLYIYESEIYKLVGLFNRLIDIFNFIQG